MTTEIEFCKEKEFQNTKIGQIPKEWVVVELGKVSETIMGQSPPSSAYNSNVGLAFLQGNAEFGSLHPTANKCTKVITKKAREGMVLLSVRAPIGALNIADKEYCIGRGLCAISLKSGENMFLFYLLNHVRKDLERLGEGSTFKAVKSSHIKNFLIALPSKEEQKQITQILNDFNSNIFKVNQEIERLQKIKTKCMETLFSKGLNNEPLKETQIGKIPKSWEIKKVNELFRLITGTTPSTREKSYWNNGSINWLTPADMSDNFIYIGASSRKITQKAIDETSLKILQKGSLLMSTRAPVGYVNILKEDSVFNQGCKALVGKDKEDDCLFYVYYIRHIRHYLNTRSAGSTFSELSKDTLSNVELPYPSKEERIKIGEMIFEIDNLISIKERKKARLNKMFSYVTDQLLSGKIRVK